MLRRWHVPLVVLVLLLSANALRWHTEVRQTNEGNTYREVIFWMRDRWTGQLWFRVYHRSWGMNKDQLWWAEVPVVRATGSDDLQQYARDQAWRDRENVEALWYVGVTVSVAWLALILVTQAIVRFRQNRSGSGLLSPDQGSRDLPSPGTVEHGVGRGSIDSETQDAQAQDLAENYSLHPWGGGAKSLLPSAVYFATALVVSGLVYEFVVQRPAVFVLIVGLAGAAWFVAAIFGRRNRKAGRPPGQ